MVEDSDDDKPVLAAVMKIKAMKQEVDTSKVKDVAEEKEKKIANGTKAAVGAVNKPSSSSDKPSREKSSSSAAEKAPVVSKTSKLKVVVKTEVIEDKSTADENATEVPKKKRKGPDSEDDLPISELMKRITRQKRVSKVKEEDKKEEDEEDEEADDDVPEKKKAPRPVADKNINVPPGLGSEFYLTKKGIIAQRLLCRWWYAIDWPKIEEIGVPPPGYESLDGFVGVFVSTRTDSLGTILDLRNKATAPCLSNFAKMSTLELKELCISAYEKQMIALAKVEGDKGKLMATLKTEMKEVKATSADKAEKEAKKYKNGL